MLILELILLLMLCAVALGWVARKLHFPYPIALVVGGAVLGLIPKLPQFPFNPQLILILVLPPILYQAALMTSWSDFKSHFRPIGLLAIGLVIATTLAVGAALKWLVPEVPWAVAFVLGAIVSPPDAVAATAILSRLNIPRRIVTVLEGESLVNDASGLVIYKFAVVAVLTGAFSLVEAGAQFVLIGSGGIVLGIVLAHLFIRIHRRLGDPFIEVLMSLVLPYVVYIAAEKLHLSGVLGVVAAGLVRGRYAPDIATAQMRIMARSVWNLLVFVLNSLIFMLIGIEMSDVIEKLSRYTVVELVTLGFAVSAVAIVVRFVWVYALAAVPGAWTARTLPDEPLPNPRELFIVSWCGMRGIVSIAAALSLPIALPDGSAFPHRQLIIFLTFFVIAMTLVVQGLSMPLLIRLLGVGSNWSLANEQQRVRAALSRAALTVIDERLHAGALPAGVADALRNELLDRIRLVLPEGAEHTPRADLTAQLRHEVVIAERRELIRLWRDNQISDEVMHHLEELLDYQEAHL
jgi:monovalent cation/hydrogen antiporter